MSSSVVIKTTPLDLMVSLSVAADCQVVEVQVQASDVIKGSVTHHHRLARIGTQLITDRSNLRSVLVSFATDSVVEVEFEPIAAVTERIDIGGSVLIDGKVSELTVCDDDALKKLHDSVDEQEPPEIVLDGLSSSTNDAVAAMAFVIENVDEKSDQQSPMHSSANIERRKSDRLLVNDKKYRSMSDTLFAFDGQSAAGGSSTSFFPPRSPQLLAFDAMDVSRRPTEVQQELSIRARLAKAIRQVQPGRCIICLCNEVNAIAEIELLAMVHKTPVVSIDVGVKLRLRPRLEQSVQALIECITQGKWFVVLRGNKSIATLRAVEDVLRDAHERNLEGMSPDFRIFVCTEPHPHFPRSLTHGAVLTRISTSFGNSSLRSATMQSSTSCARLMTAGAVVVDSANKPMPSASSPDATKRMVRISAAVDIVDIEARQIFTGGEDAATASRSAKPIDVSGSVALQHTFSGIVNDKFLCVTYAGESDRFAVGTSLGNIYFVDSTGCSLLQVHAHDASIWDISFRSKYSFATGCEDGSSTEWEFHVGDSGEESASVVQTHSTSLGADVYCVRYLTGAYNALITGGLAKNIMVRGPDGTTKYLQTPSNAQVIDAFPSTSTILVGGGDGSIAMMDVQRATQIALIAEHTRKVPTLAIRDERHFFSGSFDSTIRAWDSRLTTNTTTHTLKLKGYVTGLSVDDVHLAACVGENLYLWDVRKLGEVLGGYPQGWKGLSRGIKIQSDARSIVTASPDGHVRFWQYI